MQNALSRTGSKKPPIHLSESDYDTIADLALRMEQRSPELATLILDEIERARISAPSDLPPDVVALGSEVVFADDLTSAERRIRLVLPADADIGAGKVSVMTSVGAGLIGMRAGSEINWPCPDGRPRVLKILEVKQQP